MVAGFHSKGRNQIRATVHFTCCENGKGTCLLTFCDQLRAAVKVSLVTFVVLFFHHVFFHHVGAGIMAPAGSSKGREGESGDPGELHGCG